MTVLQLLIISVKAIRLVQKLQKQGRDRATIGETQHFVSYVSKTRDAVFRSVHL